MHPCPIFVAIALTLFTAHLTTAQPHTPPSRDVPLAVDSGWLAAPHNGEQPRVIFATEVHIPGAQWLRLAFGADTMLSGDPAFDPASHLIITSAQDGGHQRLTAATLVQWSFTSAYFNGDTLLIELHAAPGAAPSRLSIISATAGEPPAIAGSDNVCGPTDDRLPSNDPYTCRLMPVGCTAYLIDAGGCANHFITAGHCIGPRQPNAVVQFNVPFSNPNGTINHPPPEYQYPVQLDSIQTTGSSGPGNDYATFLSFANSNTGRTPGIAQRGSHMLAAAIPTPGGQELRITGYAARRVNQDPIPFEWNQTQKTGTGPYVDRVGSLLSYQVDTEGGNSGSPVILEATGKVIGVHTHGGCRPDGTGANRGTDIQHPGFQNFIANPMGLCAPFVVPHCIDTTYASDDQGPIGGAVYFDIQVGTAPIEIWGLDMNLSNESVRGATFTLDVYVTFGSHTNKETAPIHWYHAGAGVGIVEPTGNPSRMLLRSPMRLEDNRTYGLAIVLGNAGHAFSIGTGLNQQYATPHLTMTLGSATAGAFSGPLTPNRVWNGGLCYDVLPPGPPCFTTLFAANDQGPPGGAVYFDVDVADRAIGIASIAVNTTAPLGTPLTLRTYTRAGTSEGNQTNPFGWTFRDVTQANSAGPGIPTLFQLTQGFGFSEMSTNGVALILEGGGHAYTIANGLNNTHQNSAMRIRHGAASDQPFAAPLIPGRVFNGELCVRYVFPLPCYANCDGNLVLDIFDFLCFGNSFAANDPYACDCDQNTGPGVCDIFDFICFGNAFAAGCP